MFYWQNSYYSWIIDCVMVSVVLFVYLLLSLFRKWEDLKLLKAFYPLFRRKVPYCVCIYPFNFLTYLCLISSQFSDNYSLIKSLVQKTVCYRLAVVNHIINFTYRKLALPLIAARPLTLQSGKLPHLSYYGPTVK